VVFTDGDPGRTASTAPSPTARSSPLTSRSTSRPPRLTSSASSPATSSNTNCRPTHFRIRTSTLSRANSRTRASRPITGRNRSNCNSISGRSPNSNRWRLTGCDFVTDTYLPERLGDMGVPLGRFEPRCLEIRLETHPAAGFRRSLNQIFGDALCLQVQPVPVRTACHRLESVIWRTTKTANGRCTAIRTRRR